LFGEESVTVAEVAQELRRRGVPEAAYCLAGGLPNEACTLERVGDRWRVYYSERGCRSGLREFASEEAACAVFLQDVLRAFHANH
jgi:hypothetical protein